MSHLSSTVSADLIWEVTRNQNAYLVKRNDAGGVRFSRDPLNLLNTHSRKYAGYVNDKAVGVVPAEKGGVTLLTKSTKNTQKPAKHHITSTFGGNRSNRKTYSSIVNTTAKSGYRSDLRAAAVSRASAIRKSQKPVKESPEKKLRGKKALKAAEEA